MYDVSGVGKYSGIVYTSYPPKYCPLACSNTSTELDKEKTAYALTPAQQAQLDEYAERTDSRVLKLASALGRDNIIPGVVRRSEVQLADRAGTLVLDRYGRYYSRDTGKTQTWVTSPLVYLSTVQATIKRFCSLLRNTYENVDVVALEHERFVPYMVEDLHVFLAGGDLVKEPVLGLLAPGVGSWLTRGLGFKLNGMYACVRACAGELGRVCSCGVGWNIC